MNHLPTNQISLATRQIIGFVDNFSSFDTLGGWAKCSDDYTALPIAIIVYEGEAVLCKGHTRLMRGEDSKCGFSLKLPREIDISELTSDRIKVFGEFEGITGALPFLGSMLLAFEAQCIGKRFSVHGDEVASHLIHGLTSALSTKYQRCLSAAYAESKRKDRPEMLDGFHVMQGSPFLLPVGLKSSGDVAVIGYNGQIFILGGSNELLAAYNNEKANPRLISIASDWLNLFRQRASKLQKLGVRYLQVNFPDKSSVIPEKFPINIRVPTALMALIDEGALADPEIAPIYPKVIASLQNDPRRDNLYQKTDSHLAAYGCHRMMLDILWHLGIEIPLKTSFGKRVLSCGDLGGKYQGATPLEVLELPEDGDFAEYERGLVRKEYCLQDGHNRGARSVWVNSSAPVPLRVVAFANSFFGLGDVPTVLTWWAARCFREFHFIWETKMDENYVRAVGPDVVICQSVERFMWDVPES
jgi:hypothetical protein